MIESDPMFATEESLVTSFVGHLKSNESIWGEIQVGTEFNYQRGRTDVVAYWGDTMLAFEAKLTDWRTALHQAYRNRCFAHRSYVLLPKVVALRAHEYAAEFEQRQVGLCYIDGIDEIVVLQEAPHAKPLQEWLFFQAKHHVTQQETVDARG